MSRGQAGPPLLTELIREAWRNTAAGASHAAVLLVVGMLTLVVLGTAENSGVTSAVTRERDFRAAGAATLVLRAEGGVSGQRCEDLTATGQFTDAGAVREVDRTRLARLPASPLVTFEATEGARRVIAAGPVTPRSTIVSVELARDVAPALIDDPEAPPQPVGAAGYASATYGWPDDGRAMALAYAIVTPARSGDAFDECWAVSTVTTELPTGTLRGALNGRVTDPQAISVGQLNPTLGLQSSALADLTGRSSRHAPWVACAVGALLTLLVLRLRALTILTYRDDGLGFAQTLLIVLVETLLWVIPTVIASAAALLLLARDDASGLVPVLAPFDARIAMAFTGGALLSCSVGVAALWRRPVDAFLRRH